MSNKPRNILLTGGTGLIGSNLLRNCPPTDRIYAISRNGRVAGAYQTLNIDLAEQWSPEDLPTDIDVIVHLAQSNHYQEFPQKADDIFNVNTASTIRLLNFARENGAKQFVLASSGGIYGNTKSSFSEDEDIIARGDLGFYLGTRLCSELLAESYVDFMNIICLRFFFVYGEGQRPHMLVPRLIESVRTGRAMQLKGKDGISINPVHVSDAVNAVRSAMELDGSHKLNVAGPEVLTFRQIGEIIGSVIGKTPMFEQQEVSGSSGLVADITRMKQFLCEPVINFKQGLVSYVDTQPDE